MRSSAAIALRTDLFRQFVALMPYAPAYYEDTDLAMKVRAAGLRAVPALLGGGAF